MRRIYFLTSSILMLFFVQFADAQNMITKQIIVCSGGNFSDPNDFVTIAAVSPENGSTVVFDTIFTQSVQDVITHNGFAFIAAQDSIVKYNLDNYSRVASVGTPGIHNLAINNDQLIASFWYPAVENFVRIYSTTSLELVSEIAEVSGEADGIFVVPWASSAIVAVPGGWGSTTGSMAWIDLEDNTLLGESDYGESARGISFIIEYFNGIPNYYAVTKTAWGETSFNMLGFTIDGQSTGSYQFEAVLSGYTGIDNQMMYVQIDGGIGQLDLENMEIGDDLIVSPPNLSLSATVYDSVNKYFYMTSTDFTSMGEGSIFDINGAIIGNFDVGISAEAMAIDYRETTAVDEQELVRSLDMYPNPATNKINLELPKNTDILNMIITNVSGQIVYQGKGETEININSLNSGLYFTRIDTPTTVFTGKFIKR